MPRSFALVALTFLAIAAVSAAVLPSARMQQSVAQLQLAVSNLRSAVATSADPRGLIAANTSSLLERAQAAAIEAEAYARSLNAARSAAAMKVLKARSDYAVSLIEGMSIPIVGNNLVTVSTLAKQKVLDVESALAQLQLEIQRQAQQDQQELDQSKATCTKACLLPNALATCANGQCVIASCKAGWRDADGNRINGCETPDTKVGS